MMFCIFIDVPKLDYFVYFGFYAYLNQLMLWDIQAEIWFVLLHISRDACKMHETVFNKQNVLRIRLQIINN